MNLDKLARDVADRGGFLESEGHALVAEVKRLREALVDVNQYADKVRDDGQAEVRALRKALEGLLAQATGYPNKSLDEDIARARAALESGHE